MKGNMLLEKGAETTERSTTWGGSRHIQEHGGVDLLSQSIKSIQDLDTKSQWPLRLFVIVGFKQIFAHPPENSLGSSSSGEIVHLFTFKLQHQLIMSQVFMLKRVHKNSQQQVKMNSNPNIPRKL